MSCYCYTIISFLYTDVWSGNSKGKIIVLSVFLNTDKLTKT